MYSQVYWDICGICNSKCLYCPSGTRNLLGTKHNLHSNFIIPSMFEKALDYLISKEVIAPGVTQLMLYNWGDPFLHPEFYNVIKLVTRKGFHFGLSTNGSTVKYIPQESIPFLDLLIFSMPGFSQESYDRIHGFKFETILKNIKEINKNIHSVTPLWLMNTRIDMHQYKFNISEVEAASKFCREEMIYFTTKYAHLVGFQMPLNEKNYKDLSKDLFVDVLESIRQRQPLDYVCPQYNVLVFDEFCNVVQCCVLDRLTEGNIIGPIWEIDFDKLPEIRRSAPVCKVCYENKIGYLCHNSSG